MSIDDLLNQSLPFVADDGFSERVMGRVRAMERRRLFVVAASLAACFVLALLLLPLRALGAELDRVALEIAGQAPLGIAFSAIVLTFVAERQFARL